MSLQLPPLQTDKRYLVYGIGNIGRRDDGLGIQFITTLEKQIEIGTLNVTPFLSLRSNYQLNIEDAHEISLYNVVIFIDALKQDNDPMELNQLQPPDFQLTKIQSQNTINFTTHALSFEAVLSLCQELYHTTPEVYLLSIRGYQWDIQDQLTENAQSNLNIALNYFKSWLNR